MVLLGLVLLAAAVVVAVELILANRAEISVTMWNQTWHMDKFWLAVAGAAILLVGLIGLGLMQAGGSRARRIRRERRELAAENRRLNEHVAARDEVVEPAPAAAAGVPVREPVREPVAAGAARPPLGRRIADRLHHDRDHDGVDDRAEGGPAGTGYGPTTAAGPYAADRTRQMPASSAPDPRAAGWTDGRHSEPPR